MSEIQGSAEFSSCGKLRHRLDRWWSDAPRVLITMANPSDAGAERNDPTVHNVIRLTRTLPGIGGFTVVNWEPYIATDPKDLTRWRMTVDLSFLAEIHDANYDLIRRLSKESPLRIVAWGDLVPATPHTTRTLLSMSLDSAAPLHAFAFTKSGAPRHPMARGKSRIPDGAEPVIWKAAP